MAKVYDIPTVSFRIITDDKSLLAPAGVHSEQARSYGYNDFSDFERPEHYIRYIEPIEAELAVQVEYDMDEQDQEWLDVVNAERKKDQCQPVSYETFEIIMDKLEKEWFNLIKRIPQPVAHLPVEDSKCAICDDGEGENSNAIVFCDGCNLAVHQDCYGVPYIPEGQWLCRKCTVSPENPVSCLFCPNEGGAFKQTTTGHWSHLLCAIWIPELSVGNSVYMEPVEGVENVPKSRWKLNCSLCKERVGACIQCENKSCFTAFHVTCARQMGLLMSMKLMGADGQLRAYCDRHLPAEWRENREEDTDDNDDDYHDTESEDESEPTPVQTTPVPRKRGRPPKIVPATPTVPTVTPKTARAHTKAYRPGPPIVPRMIVNKLLDYVAKVSLRKKQQFIERLCRYWSLKREARRGAPLLKRLHLEPWTATSESREQTEAEKAIKMEFCFMVRSDLEKVRLLAELARKRVKEKLRQALVIQDVVDSFIFPHFDALRETLTRIVAMDKSELFMHPVDKDEVPDYYDVIKEPMTWSQIDSKIEQMEYLSTEVFKRDVMLVLDNAMSYNKSQTSFHRTASRIKEAVLPILAELDAIKEQSSLMPSGCDLVVNAGDLEPSLLRLKALLEPVDDSRDALASLFAFVPGRVETTDPTPPPRKPPRERLAPKERLAPRERPLPKERPAPRDPTRVTRAAPVPRSPEKSPQKSPEKTPAEPESAQKSKSPQKTPVDVEAKELERQRQREAAREANRAKKLKLELEKERKRNREREKRRLKKEAAARERGELPPEVKVEPEAGVARETEEGAKQAEGTRRAEGAKDAEEIAQPEKPKRSAEEAMQADEEPRQPEEAKEAEKETDTGAEAEKIPSAKMPDAEVAPAAKETVPAEKTKTEEASDAQQPEEPEPRREQESVPEADKMDVDEAPAEEKMDVDEAPEVVTEHGARKPAMEAAIEDARPEPVPIVTEESAPAEPAAEETTAEGAKAGAAKADETADKAGVDGAKVEPPAEEHKSETAEPAAERPAEPTSSTTPKAPTPEPVKDSTPAANKSRDATPKPAAADETPKASHAATETPSTAAEPSPADDDFTPPSSPGTIKPKAKPERGVLGVQSIPILTDRERREQERQLDLVTADVDARDEYKRFNVGWILPEGSKRKRVSAPPPIVLPPARRAAPRTSKTPSLPESVKSAKSDWKGKGRATSAESSTHKRKFEPSSPLSGVDDDLTPIPESAQPSADKEFLRSSLSPPPPDAPSSPKRTKRAKPSYSEHSFPPGTQVWAKVPSYPYFPAVVVDAVKDRALVPQQVLDIEAEERAKAGGRVWLARFYDRNQSWGWIPPDKIAPLGDDPDIDDMYLAGKERAGGKSGFKSSRVKHTCRAAYNTAKEARGAKEPEVK